MWNVAGSDVSRELEVSPSRPFASLNRFISQKTERREKKVSEMLTIMVAVNTIIKERQCKLKSNQQKAIFTNLFCFKFNLLSFVFTEIDFAFSVKDSIGCFTKNTRCY